MKVGDLIETSMYRRGRYVRVKGILTEAPVSLREDHPPEGRWYHYEWVVYVFENKRFYYRPSGQLQVIK